jgi:hypothetical protein
MRNRHGAGRAGTSFVYGASSKKTQEQLHGFEELREGT